MNMNADPKKLPVVYIRDVGLTLRITDQNCYIIVTGSLDWGHCIYSVNVENSLIKITCEHAQKTDTGHNHIFSHIEAVPKNIKLAPTFISTMTETGTVNFEIPLQYSLPKENAVNNIENTQNWCDPSILLHS